MSQSKNPTKYLLLSLLLIIIDQASKVLVHIYMEPGFSGQIPLIGDWLKLHYVLNPGMAFGMQLGHEYGKLFLTLFRLVAMTVICWYLIHLVKAGAPKGLLWSLSFILAGAIGNVIDSTFYGVLFDNAPYGSTTPWFHGQVIDMIFVDFWEGFIPEWVPLWGGEYYSTPIFNIADSCIFLGVCSILIFQDQFDPIKETKPSDSETEALNAPLESTYTETSAMDEKEVTRSSEIETVEPLSQPAPSAESENIKPAQSDDEGLNEKKPQ